MDNDIFIVGPVRSGTSWLQTMLAEHPDLASPPETHLFVNYLGPLDTAWRDDRARVEAALDPQRRAVAFGLATVANDDEFVALLQSFYASVRSLVLTAKPGATRLLEKTPDHALHLDTIRRVVPDAQIIYVVRDPRDTVRSLLQASGEAWGAEWAPPSMNDATTLWLRNVRPYFSRRRDPKLILVRYEDLRSDPGSLERVADFLGLEPPAAWMRTDVNAAPGARTSTVARSDIAPGTWNPYDAEGFSYHDRGLRRELSAYEKARVVLRCRDEMRALKYAVDTPIPPRLRAELAVRSVRVRALSALQRARTRAGRS